MLRAGGGGGFHPALNSTVLRSLLGPCNNVFISSLFKGTVSRDFRLLFFSWIRFPQASEYTIRAVSNFFENSRRYSQFKVHHRCRWHRLQRDKIFNHKSFNYWYRWQICHRCRWYCMVVHLDLQISPLIFEKIWNGPNGILWAGENWFTKKPDAKNLVTLSL
jgi:hypothetical protein